MNEDFFFLELVFMSADDDDADVGENADDDDDSTKRFGVFFFNLF